MKTSEEVLQGRLFNSRVSEAGGTQLLRGSWLNSFYFSTDLKESFLTVVKNFDDKKNRKNGFIVCSSDFKFVRYDE